MQVKTRAVLAVAAAGAAMLVPASPASAGVDVQAHPTQPWPNVPLGRQVVANAAWAINTASAPVENAYNKRLSSTTTEKLVCPYVRTAGYYAGTVVRIPNAILLPVSAGLMIKVQCQGHVFWIVT